ncbi:tandem-95 repeat protein [Leptolyngbya sp. FACHB-541]|uniref:tandem-95 repeat protein n=1 Tax=Leptolyngbya sp. FACHB-541 TaxID=2692810 RepID=UPI001685E6C4|nr:tandem-95 repeat protein [Leptolyngbya sp. FACHB-541]MBD1996571.1 tandem-95 repeat protein [Leptolyngbya sp. FACHB-541]
MLNSSILFIDATVKNYQNLLFGIEPSTQVFVLNSEEDGVRQITDLFAKNPGYSNVHIVSHGSPGCLYLGQTQLTLDTLDRYAWDLKTWFTSFPLLPSPPSLLLYGCNVAVGDAGAEFIEKLHQFTGAQIAASTSPVGHASLGGTWQLDHKLGQVQATLPIAPSTLATYEGVLAAPVISDSITITRAVDEDKTLSITGISVSDADAADIQTVTLSIAQGLLNLASTSGLSGITGGGTGSISFSGTLSAVNAALAGMLYKPGLNYSGNETLAIIVNDGTQSVLRNVAIAVTPVNDTPTIAPSGISVAEGGNNSFNASNFGIADVDNENVQIIVKLDSLPSKGYLTFNGNFLVVGSTFSYDQTAQLRYVHSGAQTTAPGGTSDTFTITVDDGAGGTIGVTTIPVTITPVNQLPTVSGTNTLFEGETNHPIAISISDPDQTASNYTVEILTLPVDGVLKLGSNSVIAGQTLSSADLANLTYSHDSNDDNFGNPPPDGFTIRVIDDGGGTGTPGSTTSTVNLNIQPNNDDPVLVRNTGLRLNTLSEGLTKVITPADLSVTDPDSPTTQLTYTLTAAPDVAIGGLERFNGTSWVRIGVGASFTQDDLNNSRVRYAFHKSSSGNEGFADSFSFQVRDGEIREYPSTREGGIWKSDGSALQTLTFNINIDVPATGSGGTGGTQNPTVVGNTPPVIELNKGLASLSEGTSTLITNALLRATDTDNIPSAIVYRITGLPSSGSIQLNGTSLGLYSSFTQDDINKNRVTFNHAGNEDFDDNFRFTVSDGTNVTFEQTFTIDATPVNDAPTVATSGSPFLVEAGTLVINNSYLSLSDVDGTGEKSGIDFATPNSLTFRVVTLPTYGSLQVDQGSGFVTVTSGTIITKAQLDGGKLLYIHNGTENFTDSFAVQADDNTGTLNKLSTIQTVNLTIASLNDNPAFASSTSLTVAEAGSGIIKGSNRVADNEPHLLYTDSDNTTVQRQYRITDATDNGTLFRNGQALSVGSVFTQADLDNNRITYTHNGSENYTDAFKFTVSDGGGAAVPGNYTIAITPTNDAPQLAVPTAQIFNTDTPLTFSNASGNRITAIDVDLDTLSPGETDVLKVTLDLQVGEATYTASTLTLGSISGLTVTGSNGTLGGTVTFKGTKASIQAALDGLQVQVPTDEDRVLSLVVTVDDLNNGGPNPSPSPSGYSTTVTKSIALFTSNDNDAPTIASPASVTATEDVAFGFTGGNVIAIADVDAFTSTVNTVTLNVTKGTLTLTNSSLITSGANNSSTITLTGSLSAINSALIGLSYKGNSNVNGSDTLTIVANDQGNTGLNGGVNDPKSTTQTVNITLAPVNDQPTLAAPTAVQTISDTSPKIFSTANGNAITIDDIADLPLYGLDNFTITLNAIDSTTSLAYGILTVATGSGASVSGDGTASVTITGTKAQVNATLNGLGYAPTNYNSEATVTLAVVVNDTANGGPGALTDTKNITIQVSDFNDPPVITNPTTITATEDQSFSFTGTNLISLADPDDFGKTLSMTLTVGKGTLAFGTITGLTFTNGTNGSASVTVTGTKAALNTALSTLTYQSTANVNGSDALSILVNDLGNTGAGGAKTDSETVNITINPINDAPTRTIGSSVPFGTVPEDAALTGTLVSSLFGSKFVDNVDQVAGGSSANNFAGIAITNNLATSGTQGRWQWSTDGTTWNNVGTGVSTTEALVVVANSYLRFLPKANYNGAVGNLSVRLIDDSQGSVASGNIVNVGSGGGTTPYSNSNNAISLTTSVTAVNDAPIATGSSTLAAVNEDAASPAGDTITNLFTTKFSDITDQVTNGSTANTLVGVAIVGNAVTTEGIWQYFNGTTWQAVGNPSATNALIVSASDKLRFVPAANYNGAVPALNVHLIDSSTGTVTTGTIVNLSGGGAIGGTTRYSASTVPLTSSINPVNDAPTFNNLGGSVSFTENGTAVILDADAIANDIELGGLDNWNGASLTLHRQGGGNSQDAFGNSGTLGTLAQGSSFVVNGVTIGTVTANSGGTLVLTFNANATTVLVNSALQQVTYRNISEDPPSSVAIAYTLNDDNTGAQGSGGALAATGTVIVNITPLSDAPVISTGATLAYTENQTARVVDNTVTVADVDDTQIRSATVTISNGFTTGDVLAAVTGGTNITASYNSNTGVLTLSGTDTLARYQQVMRSVTYLNTSETPTQTTNTRTVSWQVTDANSDGAGAATSTPVTSTITINALPDPVNDAFSTNEDTLLSASVADADIGDGPATYAVSSAPSHGVLNFNPNGSFTYTPSPDYNGSDSFTYRVTDANGDIGTAIATITVNPVADILNDSSSTNEDTPVTIAVLDNDTFALGATVTSATNGSNGNVVINSNGTVTYTPKPNFFGADSFTYTVISGGMTETTTVNVTVDAVPDPVNDTFSTSEDTLLSGSVADPDAGDGPATYVITGAPNHGALNFNLDGSFTYTPNPDFNGTDTFTYQVTDANGDVGTAIATITVNLVTDILNDSSTTNEDTPVKIPVLGNDSFASGATVTSVTNSSNGSVVINPDGTVTYTPKPDFNGNDSFTYTVSSGGVTETATVNVIVSPVADILNDSSSTDEDTPVTISVLDNDSFASGATVTAVTNGSNGSVVINPDGTVTYTPKPDFNGNDSFTYTVTTVAGNTETVTVNVTVNPAVDILNNSSAINEDTSVTISVLDNDSFASGATVTAVTNGSNGSVVINPDSTVTYTPKPDFNGNDSFTYTVSSGGVTETATVNVTVNPATDILNDSSTTDEDTPVTIPVLGNDSFVSGATVTSVTNSSNGSVVINPDGTVTYTPKPDFNGNDSFTYTVSSGGVTETATVNVTVNPAVDILNDSSSTDEDTPIKISLLGNDSFTSGATVTSVTNGSNGTVVINSDGTVTYTPKPDFNGNDSFTYTVSSGGVTETATVNVTINPAVDILNDSSITNEDTSVTIPILDNDSFASGATVTAVTNGSNGTVVINSDGIVTYTPKRDFNGNDSFTYTVSSSGVTETATVNVTINPAVDVLNDSSTTNEGTSVIIPVLDNDSFASGATVTSVTNGSNGSVVINPDGTVTYTPKLDFNGNDSFTYTVTTVAGNTETATVNVTVNPAVDSINDSSSTNEDTPITIPVLGNDTFASGTTVTAATNGSNGTVVINSDGTVTYTPKPDFSGNDSFTYTATTVTGDTETATVNVIVNPVADIISDNNSTDEDTPVVIPVLTNDSFASGATVTSVTNGSNGNVDINPDGTVTYTPNLNFNGRDSFTYTVTSSGVIETATVNIAVDAVPDPANDAFTTSEDVLVSGSVADVDMGDEPATYTVTNVPSNGILSFNSDGTFIYTPNSDFNGTDAFTYQVTDTNGDAVTAIATILVKPVADVAGDSGVTQKGKPVVINALGNDSFENSNAQIQSITQGRNGTVSINPDGTLTYTPNTSFVGTDRFTYTVRSGGVNETATVSIQVSPPPGPTPNNGSSGPDIVIGTNGDDILNGFSDIDILRGLGGNDIINGGSSRDVMRGDDGNDILNGGSGNDDMRAGTGKDILNGGSGQDLMLGGTENDILNGGLGNDRIYGEAGQDTLDGGDGRDRLHGGLDNDTLRGGRGDDLLTGGVGKDTLTGGQGRDQFIYTSVGDFGDVITDFEIVKDRINFRPIQGIQSMRDLRFTQKGDDTLLKANINGSLKTVAVLEDVNASTLSQRHFIF